jgi:hypothetical protein
MIMRLLSDGNPTVIVQDLGVGTIFDAMLQAHLLIRIPFDPYRLSYPGARWEVDIEARQMMDVEALRDPECKIVMFEEPAPKNIRCAFHGVEIEVLEE